MKLKARYPSWEVFNREAAVIINNFNVTGEVTLTLASTTTAVSNAAARATSHINLMPLDANAAAEAPYISARATGSFTITHANAGTTRTFSYQIVNK